MLLLKKKKVIILLCFVHLPALLLDIISLSLSSIMFEKCPVGTSALSCNTSLWCFINLTVAGTQGWLGVHQFQPFFNYSIVWEVASYQSLMFLRGNVMTSCSAVIVGGGREREDRIAWRSESIAERQHRLGSPFKEDVLWLWSPTAPASLWECFLSCLLLFVCYFSSFPPK